MELTPGIALHLGGAALATLDYMHPHSDTCLDYIYLVAWSSFRMIMDYNSNSRGGGTVRHGALHDSLS